MENYNNNLKQLEKNNIKLIEINSENIILMNTVELPYSETDSTFIYTLNVYPKNILNEKNVKTLPEFTFIVTKAKNNTELKLSSQSLTLENINLYTEALNKIKTLF